MPMEIVTWKVPVVAPYRRSVELIGINYKHSQVWLTLVEEDSRRMWDARFETVQAFKVVTWESGAHTLSRAPGGGFFEVMASSWLEELGVGLHQFLNKSRHFVVCTYDEI